MERNLPGTWFLIAERRVANSLLCRGDSYIHSHSSSLFYPLIIQQCRLRGEFTTGIQGKGYLKKLGHFARHFTKSLVGCTALSFRENKHFFPFWESHWRADLSFLDNCSTAKMYRTQFQNVVTDYKDCKSKGRRYAYSTPHTGLLLTNHCGRGKAMFLFTTNPNHSRNLQSEILHED